MPPPPDAPIPPERTLGGVLGLELLDLTGERARGRFEVTDALRQPLGIVHGGAYAAMAETLTSAATHQAVEPQGMVALGQSNSTSYLRAVSSGAVHAEARTRHQGRGSWVWDVEFTDDQGRLCAISRVTVAVRPQRSAG